MRRLTREECRNADRFAIEHLKIPGIILMENAGRSCAERILELGAGNGAVICCGGGNNGGDGFVIARHVFNRGILAKVILFADPISYRGDAATNLRIIERMPIPIVLFDSDWNEEQRTRHFSTIGRTPCTWLIDAMLGTGAQGNLRSPFGSVIPHMNRLDIKRMAVDIPTGLDCDLGTVHPTAFRSDLTCTFIAEKTGFANPKAAEYLGHVRVIEIGILSEFITGNGHQLEGKSNE